MASKKEQARRRNAARLAYIAKRNPKIIAAYIAGDTREVIAKRYKVTPRQVSRIIALAGATQPWPELHQARKARPGYNSGGRAREIFLPPEDMRHYVKIRALLGASEARAAFGIAA